MKGIGIKMNKEILDPKVYYYTDAIENFDNFMSILNELDGMEFDDNTKVNLWQKWTSSNDKDFIYGETKTFDIYAISKSGGIVGEKSKYIYDSVMTTMYNVCKIMQRRWVILMSQGYSRHLTLKNIILVWQWEHILIS